MIKDIYKSFQTEVTSFDQELSFGKKLTNVIAASNAKSQNSWIIGDQFHSPPPLHLQWNLRSKVNCIILPYMTLKSFIISWISQLKIFPRELKSDSKNAASKISSWENSMFPWVSAKQPKDKFVPQETPSE